MAKKKPVDAPLLRAGNTALIAGALAAVVVAAIWYLFTGPARGEAEQAHATLTTTQSALATQEARLSDLMSNKQRSAASLLAKGFALDAALPSQVSRTDLVARIDEMARRSGVVLTQMNPGQVTTAGAATGQGYDVTMSGSPAAVATLLAAVQQMNPTVTMSGFSMTATPASGQTPATAAVTVKLTSWSVAEAELPRN